MIKIGEDNLKARYIGTNKVGRVYIGSDKVWETEDWYGIKWTEDSSVTTNYIQRIGNIEMHQTLPLQSMMRRCMVQDNGTVYKYISNTNPFQYEDGTTANYDGTDGQCMVEIPAYHHESYQATENGVIWNYLKLYPDVNLGVTSPKYYYAAFEMMQDNSDNSAAKGSSVSILDFNTMGITTSTTSINAADIKYISGKENYRNYNYSNTDTTNVKCSYGRPTTNRNRATFRTIASNRGTRWSQKSWDAYCSLIRLYIVEYCNLNSQATFNSNTTAEGYKQGGLGSGVTTTDSTTWNNFNSYNSFVPCGITISLGNKTGNINYIFAANEFSSSAVTFSVPSYRGIENPFGHIWEFIDGFNRMGVSGNKENIYVCHDVTKFAENAATGYELISNTTARATGDFGGVSWDNSGTFWPKPGGRTIYSDYFYNSYSNNTWYTLYAGGNTNNGARAGLFYLYGHHGAADAGANMGSRLLYTPTTN